MSTIKVFKHVGLENLMKLVQYSDFTGKFVAYRTFNRDMVLFNARPVSEKHINFHCNSFVSIGQAGLGRIHQNKSSLL